MVQLNNLLRSFTFTLTLLASSFSFASFDGMITVKGKLAEYSDNYVWLLVPAGKQRLKAKFNRKDLPDIKGYNVGAAELRVTVAASDFFYLNPDFAK